MRASFVMPVLNEEHYIAAAVASVLAQDGLDEREILLVLGASTDRTDEVVAGLAALHAEIRVLHNPQNAISQSMNIGIAEARFPVVIRVDAHSVLPDGYAATAVRSLRAAGAVNLGGRMHAEGRTPYEQAVAWGYNSPGGLGGAVYHTGGEAGPAESAYLGVFDRAAVLAIGGFDETLSRGEDWDLNRRLMARGGLVWFEPALDVVYRPRSSVKALAKQFHASGRWRGEIIRRLGGRVPLRYFVPPALLAALVAGAAMVVAGAVAGGAVGIVLAALGALPYVVYPAWVAITALRADVPTAVRVRLLGVLPTMHLSWGVGCAAGILMPSRGHNAFAGR
ncbi:glycosyltransferase family 2 protein [Demequina sp. SYSU T00192]|uniref:Glycosyltransferase family 2 protein n=2 Tax=Demequina litoralis TaxID=3051660 RepID=A0ABT8G7X0_9MICO|nr:glycosyltransferase family 2 protein [Demequina sp. SYSU T00192]MDN4475152.1 glycosyltransferase family 2 protein [Demequina sp. SYSU T00192]